MADKQDHHIDPQSERYLCSPEHLMPTTAGGRWAHTNVEEIGDQVDNYPCGDLQRMRCRDCGATWWTELPQ
jgi:hypothetical protein